MRELVLAAASGAVLTGLLMIVVIASRRTLLTIRGAREEKLAARLRPAALALVIGRDRDVPALNRKATEVFARVLAEMAPSLRGDARLRISAVADELGLLARQLRILRTARRSWQRAAAARVLGHLGSGTVVPALIDALEDNDRDVRATAALSLGHLGAAEAAEAITAALRTRAIPRAIVVRALLRMGPSAVPALRRAAAFGEPQARRTAIELVGHLGAASDAGDMLPHLRDQSSDVRAAAARTLGRLGSRSALDPLIAALRDPQAFVRGAAAEALGRLRARTASDALLEQATTDPSWWASTAAARALSRIDPEMVADASHRPHASASILEAADVLAI